MAVIRRRDFHPNSPTSQGKNKLFRRAESDCRLRSWVDDPSGTVAHGSREVWVWYPDPKLCLLGLRP